MDNRPIGIFDSGLGGLTCVKKVMEILPGEDIIYFGDTGRVRKPEPGDHFEIYPAGCPVS